MKMLSKTILLCPLLFWACNYVPNTHKEDYVREEHTFSKLFKDEEAEKSKAAKTNSGLKVEKYPSGKVKTRINYSHGKREGVGREYFENGKVYKDAVYKDDKLEGVVKVYDSRGRLSRTVSYTEGRKNGKLTRYFPSGKPKSEMTYMEGAPQPDLWEKDARGMVNTDFGKLQVEVVKDRNEKNTFYLKVSMAEKARHFDCYVFPSDVTLSRGIHPRYLVTKDAVHHHMPISVSEGTRFAISITAVGVYKTPMRNEAVLSLPFDYEISNP